MSEAAVDVSSRTADQHARVTEHLWLADSLARRYQHRGEDLDDLIQVARAGLVEAARRFDPSYGPFVAFAVPTISGVLKRHFRDHCWLIRPPRRTQEVAAQIRQQWADLVQDIRGEPTAADFAQRLDASVADIREARHANQWYAPASLDVVLTTGAGPADDSGRERDQAEARVVVSRLWRLLEPAERRLLWLRFYEQRTQSDIAGIIGTSQMQVSRLLSRTLRRLRAVMAGDETDPASERPQAVPA